MLDALLRVNSRIVRPGEFISDNLIKQTGLSRIGLVRRVLAGAGLNDNLWETRDVIVSLADDAVVYRPGQAATPRTFGCTTLIRLTTDRQRQIERISVRVNGIAGLRQSGVRKLYGWFETKYGRPASTVAGTNTGIWSDAESVLSLGLENDDNDLLLEWYLVSVEAPETSQP